MLLRLLLPPCCCLFLSTLRFHRLTALLVLAILCVAVELAGVLSGFTFHQNNANVVSALAHLLGFLATISMVLNGWTVNAYPFVFAFCR